MSTSSAPTTESASENGHGHGASSSPSPLTKGSSFWYLDNPSYRKRKIYSGPYEGKKIVLAMVGLPARAKTYLAMKTARYLNWLGYTARVFNTGEYGRIQVEQGKTGTGEGEEEKKPGFDHYSKEATNECQKALWEWLGEGGQIGVYDNNNVTKEERDFLEEEAGKRNYQVIFIESICNEPSIVLANIRDSKHNHYSRKSKGGESESEGEGKKTEGQKEQDGEEEGEEIEKDFHSRIAHFSSIYEPLEDDKKSYIKIIQHDHYDRKVITNRLKGYISSRIAFFISNLHIVPRHIFLSRHGESQDNVSGRIGGDSSLSDRGKNYAKKLAEFIMAGKPENCEFKIWTSTLHRSIETSQHFNLPTVQWKVLNEIHAGICEGMTYKQIEDQYPEEFAARSVDKFNYRYPQGESYADLVQRLEPVIIELERQYDPVLVIGHQAVLRVLYAYFSGKDAKECPHLDVPLHTVAQLTPRAYGCEEQHFKLC